MDDDFRSGGGARVGFRTYADGTPRGDASQTGLPAQDIPSDDLSPEAWGVSHAEDEPDRPRAPENATRAPRHQLLLGASLAGSGAAVAGLLIVIAIFGRTPERSAAFSREARQSKVAIQVARAGPIADEIPTATPLDREALRAEVLMAPMTKSGNRKAASEPVGRATARQTPSASDADSAKLIETPEDPMLDERAVMQSAPRQGEEFPDLRPEYPRRAQVVGPEAPAARTRLPGPLNCDHPASPGQRIVCQDPQLVEADRRMVMAYGRASAAGAPPSVLWQEQVSWLNAREDAARRSNSAVAMLYRERIRDLEAESFVSHR